MGKANEIRGMRVAFFAACAIALALFTCCASGTALAVDTTPTSGAVDQPANEGSVAPAPDVKARVQVASVGWKPTVTSGNTAGTTSKKGLRKIKLSLVGISGSICYRTHTVKSGWTKTAKNGKASGSGKRNITGVKVWLTGAAAKKYNVYYRMYFKGYGWLGWAKNKQVAGTTKDFAHASAIQVKLVAKGAAAPGRTASHQVKSRWRALEYKYSANANVKQILEVKYTGGTRAKVVLRQKSGAKWKTVLSCWGCVGAAGIGKAREGSTRTPSGDFGISKAFGIKSNPGAKLPYVKVTKSMYWCSDRAYYNQLIDIKKQPHNCSGEHLINISPYYDYGLFFDYNTNPIKYGKGSAFFVHCSGGLSSTEGCIAVSTGNMKKIIRNVEPGARLCIYKK